METKNLQIRNWKLNDAEDAFAIWSNPNVLKYIDSLPYRNVEEAQKNLKRALSKHDQNGYYRWAVVEKKSRKVIGGCGFHPFDKQHGLELAYHFGEEYWGQGYGTEAVEACLNFAKNNHITEFVFAGVHPENIASRKILEKFNFKYVGTDKGDHLYELNIVEPIQS